jgi:hypothetical protein
LPNAQQNVIVKMWFAVPIDAMGKRGNGPQGSHLLDREVTAGKSVSPAQRLDDLERLSNSGPMGRDHRAGVLLVAYRQDDRNHARSRNNKVDAHGCTARRGLPQLTKVRLVRRTRLAPHEPACRPVAKPI